MSGKSMKKMLLLLKEEVTAGVDSTPTAALNAILVRGLTPNLINADFVARNLIRPFKGNASKLIAGVHRVFEFEVEIAGAGTAGGVPKYDPILKAAGMSQTVTAGTSVVYAPVSSGEPTVTAYVFLDGLKFTITNGIMTVALEFNAKNIPVMKCKLMGEYAAMTDTAIPTGVDYTGFTQPQVVGKLFTPTFTFFGATVPCSAFSFDVAAQQTYRDLIGGGGPVSPDRQPAGSATIELGTVAAKNWGTTVLNGTKGAIQLVHGTAAGNIVEVNVAAAQITSSPTIADQDSIAMLSMNYDAMPISGNDEFTITVR